MSRVNFLWSFSTSIKNKFVSEILISIRSGNCMRLNEIGDDENKYNEFFSNDIQIMNEEWKIMITEFVGSWIKKLSKTHLMRAKN